MSVILEVEPKWGVDIVDVCRDCVTMANSLNVTISYVFNGTRLYANPGMDYLDLVNKYRQQEKRTKP